MLGISWISGEFVRAKAGSLKASGLLIRFQAEPIKHFAFRSLKLGNWRTMLFLPPPYYCQWNLFIAFQAPNFLTSKRSLPGLFSLANNIFLQPPLVMLW